MRLCVRWLHVCAGEEKRTLRKSAFWTGDVTEKRILGAVPHGKAHSGRPLSGCRMRFSVRVIPRNALFHPQSASLRESPVAEWGTCVRRCDAIRRGVNPREPPKSRKLSTNREKLLVLLAIERAFSKLLKLLCGDMTLSGHCRNQTSRDIALGAVTYLCPDGRS